MVQKDQLTSTAPARSKRSRFQTICFLPWTHCWKISTVGPDIGPTSSCDAEVQIDSRLQDSCSTPANDCFVSQNHKHDCLAVQSKSSCISSGPILANGQAPRLLNAEDATQHGESPGTPACSPVAVQAMANRGLDLLSNVQITCPHCLHSFQYRLPANDRMVAAAGTYTLTCTSCVPQP